MNLDRLNNISAHREIFSKFNKIISPKADDQFRHPQILNEKRIIRNSYKPLNKDFLPNITYRPLDRINYINNNNNTIFKMK